VPFLLPDQYNIHITLFNRNMPMTISDSIQRAQNLLQQLATHQQVVEHDELTALATALSQELENIKSQGNVSATAPTSSENKLIPQIDKQSGCYKFDNEQGFFCPNCYDQSASRVPTKRLNRQLRVCPTCRASIKPSL